MENRKLEPNGKTYGRTRIQLWWTQMVRSLKLIMIHWPVSGSVTRGLTARLQAHPAIPHGQRKWPTERYGLGLSRLRQP